MADMIIYKITNLINGKVYIGQTTRTLEERMNEHYRKSDIVVDKAIQKYGRENFSTEVVDDADSIEELNEKEIYWIRKYDSILPLGYNQCNGGNNTVGFHHREESKRRMSDSKKILFIGESNPFFGKVHSSESKKKMSEKRLGMSHLTKEQVKKLRESHFIRKVKNIDTGEVFNSIKEASKTYGLKETHITRVCKGRRKRTGGFRWEYVEV